MRCHFVRTLKLTEVFQTRDDYQEENESEAHAACDENATSIHQLTDKPGEFNLNNLISTFSGRDKR